MIYGVGNPALWLGIFAALLPVALHLLNRKPRRRVDFPALAFLLKAQKQIHSHHSLWKWLILLLRVAGVAALTAAFCLPYRTSVAPDGKTAKILVWDDSASMQTQNVLEKQRMAFLAELGAVTPEHPAMLGIWRDDRVLWSGPFTGNAAELEAFFRRHARNASGGDFAGLPAQCELRFLSTPARVNTLTIFTDRQELPWRRTARQWDSNTIQELRIVRPSAGEPPVNLALTTLRTEATNDGFVLHAVIRNYADRAITGRLVVETDGTETETAIVTVPPGGSAERSVAVVCDRAARFGRTVFECGDDLEIDNIRYFAVPPRGRRAAVAPGNAGVFPALALELEQAATPEAPARFRVENAPGQRSETEINALETFVRRGGTLALTPDATPRAANFLARFGVKLHPGQTAEAKAARFGSLRLDHPVFAPLFAEGGGNWREVLFLKRYRFTLPAGATVLAEFDDGEVAIAELAAGDGRLILIAAPALPGLSNWQGHYSYLPFWRELEKYAINREIRPEFFVNAPLPAGNASLEIHENGAFRPFAELRPDRPGVYRRGDEYFAVNLRPAESDLTPDFMDRMATFTPAPENAAPLPDSSVPAAAAARDELFLYALVAAMACGLAATLLANRTAL